MGLSSASWNKSANWCLRLVDGASHGGMGIERDLVARAKLGDLDAFSALTAGRTSRLYGAARLILRDGALAEEVVQETLVRAWQDIRALRDLDRFDAWVQRILIRTCYRAAARNRRRMTIEVHLGDADGPAVPDTQNAVTTHDQLARGLQRLTPQQRAVIVLHHYQGYSLSESAGILGIPLGTMQSRLFRALQAMRAAIEADERTAMLEGEPG